MPKKNQLFYLRAHRTEKEYLVSACDENVLGKTQLTKHKNENKLRQLMFTTHHCLFSVEPFTKLELQLT